MATAAMLETVSDGLTTASTTYVSNDVLDNEFIFTSAATSGSTGTIFTATIVDKGDVLGPTQLYLYDTSAAGTDNAAFAPSDAQGATYLGVINFPPPDDNGGVRQGMTQCQIQYKLAGGSTSLYGVLVTRSAHSFFAASTDITIRLHVVKD